MRVFGPMVAVVVLQLCDAVVAAARTVVLDLASVQSRAERSSLAAKVADLQRVVLQAQATVDGLGPMLAPWVEVQGGPCSNTQLTFCNGATVNFPLPLPGETAASRRLGKAGAAAAMLDAAAVRWRVRLAAGIAYVRALAGRELYRLATRSLGVASDLLEVVARRAREGDAARLDEMQVLGRRLQRKREAASARLEERAALDALRRLLLLRSEPIELRESFA
jgi:outer membrane protein TolC